MPQVTGQLIEVWDTAYNPVFRFYMGLCLNRGGGCGCIKLGQTGKQAGKLQLSEEFGYLLSVKAAQL